MHSEVINSPSLVDLIRERLIADIMGHRYQPGQKIPVSDVSTRYGVSETPIKQAFQRLVSEGLLETLPRRGVVVRRLSRRYVLELVEARQMLNLATVDVAIERYRTANSSFRKAIEGNIAEHEALVPIVGAELDVGTFLDYIRIDAEFHYLYLQCLDNSVIERQFNQLYYQARVFISLSGIVAERVLSALTDHRAIVAATATGEPLRLFEALNNHKRNAIRIMTSLLAQEE